MITIADRYDMSLVRGGQSGGPLRVEVELEGSLGVVLGEGCHGDVEVVEVRTASIAERWADKIFFFDRFELSSHYKSY